MNTSQQNLLLSISQQSASAGQAMKALQEKIQALEKENCHLSDQVVLLENAHRNQLGQMENKLV